LLNILKHKKLGKKDCITQCCLQCCGSETRIRCLFDPWTRDPNRFFPDPGSLKFGPSFVLQQFKNKIIENFVSFVATKKGMTTNFPGSGINIPDPQHWLPILLNFNFNAEPDGIKIRFYLQNNSKCQLLCLRVRCRLDLK
jgi:hypothetical protein